jgi:hypothetical protein
MIITLIIIALAVTLLGIAMNHQDTLQREEIKRELDRAFGKG